MALTREFTARVRLSVPAPNSLSLTFPDAVPIHGGLDGGPNWGVVRLVLLTNSDRSPHFLGDAPMSQDLFWTALSAKTEFYVQRIYGRWIEQISQAVTEVPPL